PAARNSRRVGRFIMGSTSTADGGALATACTVAGERGPAAAAPCAVKIGAAAAVRNRASRAPGGRRLRVSVGGRRCRDGVEPRVSSGQRPRPRPRPRPGPGSRHIDCPIRLGRKTPRSRKGRPMPQQIPIAPTARAAEYEVGGAHEVGLKLAYQRLAIVNVVFYGVRGAGGGRWVLIDAGIAGTAALILNAAARLYGTGPRPAAIVLTHGHFDHVGAL